MFLAESRERSSRDGMTCRSMIDYESQKIIFFFFNCALHYRGGTVFFHEMFWFMTVSPGIVDGHVR